MSFVLRTATLEDVKEVYGKRHQRSMYALVIEIDGAVEGIGGIYYDQDKAVAFCNLSEKVKSYPVALYKASRKVTAFINSLKLPAIAIADPAQESSERFLTHLGFIKTGTSAAGEVYEWTPR